MKKLLLALLAAAVCGACAAPNSARDIAIVPCPNHIKAGTGSYPITGAAIYVDEQLDAPSQAAIAAFCEQLQAISEAAVPLSVQGEMPSKGIRFALDTTLPAEGYRLAVTRSGVQAAAADFHGILYAIQSIKQLLPAAIYGSTPAPEAEWAIPCVEIVDAPRFAYRGMMFDVARHFFTADEVKRYLDLMAIHKMNTLHWHLSDDQGWRIEIKRYPELIQKGSVRKGSMIGKLWGTNDGIPHGGYYTQDEIRDVVAYAASLGITIIPEIDLPGHMVAALATYPELGCTGGPYEVRDHWGVADDVLCPGKEKTFEFIEGVLTEVMELFPSEYIHIGGDECPKIRWEKCPHCQARIRALGLKDTDEFSAEHYLQSYVTARVEKFLGEHGRRIIGWDEILEGELSPGATVMSWRGSSGGIRAAQMGHDVIMTPNSHFYFDYGQSLDPGEPLNIGGYVPVKLVYSFDPMDQLTPEQGAHILGVQANLWTEYIDNFAYVEYMVLPRMAALSEVQWCQPEVRDWERFLDNFRMDRIYTAMGCNFAKHIFGVEGSQTTDPEKGCLVVTLSTQGDAPIYYTTDGSEPTPASQRYTAPIEIRESCTLRAAAGRDYDAPQFSREYHFNKATAREAIFQSAPAPRYLYGGAMSLVDGCLAKPGFSNGSWVGFLDEPLDVVIKMAGAEPYASVALELLSDKDNWIFMPVELIVSTSEDGVAYTETARVTLPVEGRDSPNGIKEARAEFPATQAPYLRIAAVPVASLPAWHGAAGQKGYLFVSEITVE